MEREQQLTEDALALWRVPAEPTTAGTYVAVREFRIRGGTMQPPKAKNPVVGPVHSERGFPFTARPLGRAQLLDPTLLRHRGDGCASAAANGVAGGSHEYASGQKAKASPAARTIPKPRTAIATGSYAGINMVGPSMAPTPAAEINSG
jgi:hypothetical protein